MPRYVEARLFCDLLDWARQQEERRKRQEVTREITKGKKRRQRRGKSEGQVSEAGDDAIIAAELSGHWFSMLRGY